MADCVVEKAIDYTCVQCARSAVGRYVAGGWWQHPFGWLAHDDGLRWTCSVRCAQAASTPRASAQAVEVSQTPTRKLPKLRV